MIDDSDKNVRFTQADLSLLSGLVVAEARHLNYRQYQHARDYPPRLKALARVRRKILKLQGKWE